MSDPTELDIDTLFDTVLGPAAIVGNFVRLPGDPDVEDDEDDEGVECSDDDLPA